MELNRNALENSESSLGELQATFEAITREWELDGHCRWLCSALETAPALTSVTKIVAFACSTIRSSDPACQRASIAQYAAVITTKNFLQCFALDPAYTDVDRAVLQRAGITVLDDPGGFCEVDDSTIILSSCPDVPVRQIVVNIARPVSMMIS